MRRKSNFHDRADVPIANRIEYALFKTAQGFDHLAEQDAVLDVLMGCFRIGIVVQFIELRLYVFFFVFRKMLLNDFCHCISQDNPAVLRPDLDNVFATSSLPALDGQRLIWINHTQKSS